MTKKEIKSLIEAISDYSQFIDKKVQHYDTHNPFSIKGEYSWYKLDNDEYILSETQPWKKAIACCKSHRSPYKPKEAAILFKLSEGLYYCRKQTDYEKTICCSRGLKTGWISRGKRVYINPLDFNVLTLKKHFWNIHIVSGSKNYFEITRSDEFLAHPNPYALKHKREFDVTFTIEPIKDTFFLFPIWLFDRWEIAGEEYLETVYSEDGVLFKAPARTCAVCGTKIDQFSGKTQIWSLCKPCDDIMPRVQAYMQSHKMDADVFEGVLSEINEQCNEIAALLTKFGG